MECPRCKNTDNTYFFKIGSDVYCRKCIMFSRVNIHDVLKITKLKYPQLNTEYTLEFELSKRQKEISLKLVENYKYHVNSYVSVVCGGGKTELVFEVIRYALSKGHRVCFCVPRKELVRELYERIQLSFSNVEIGLFYGGVSKNQDAQFIICTMHQLYRFENPGFDLMIADEVDAFPFYGNDVLQAIFHNCVRGSFIKMSATFKDDEVKDGEILSMNRRYHGYDLPVPRTLLFPLSVQKYIVLFFVLSNKRRWIIYVPTITIGEKLYSFLKRFISDISFVSSKTLNNKESIQSLKEKERYTLISTTLLERGITVEDVHVIVYQGDHHVYDTRTLIQIAGRVGRKPQHPTGDIFILHSSKSKEITKCIQTIRQRNKTA